MYGSFRPIILMAEQSRWDSLSQSFSSGLQGRAVDAGDLVTAMLILAGIAAVVWLIWRFMPWHGRQRTYSSRLGLFLSLCKAHGLRWREYWWLWRLARHQRLRDPARLFLEPERFAAANLSPALRSKAEPLARLRDRLFAGPPKRAEAEPTRPQQPAKSPNKPPAVTPLLPTPARPILELSPWATAPGRTQGLPPPSASPG